MKIIEEFVNGCIVINVKMVLDIEILGEVVVMVMGIKC